MAKTQEELNQLKVECETLNNKLKELTDEELNIVTGGTGIKTHRCPYCNTSLQNHGGTFTCPKCGWEGTIKE